MKIPLALCLLAALGCDEPTTSLTPDVGPEAELLADPACRLLRGPAGATATVMPSMRDSDVAILAPDIRFEIDLPGGAGFLGYRPLEPGLQRILVDEDVPLAVIMDDVVLRPTPRPWIECGADVQVYEAVLPFQRVRFAFGPSTQRRVGLAIFSQPLPKPDAGVDPPDAGRDALNEAYCECMLFNCHDPFHERWGEDDGEAIANCLATARDLPREGAPTDVGPSLECRHHFCRAAQDTGDEPGHCPQALGQTTCVGP